MNSGAAWKAEREARGITIEEAATRLRIAGKYLQGIENGDYSGWPARVFSSGYIRSYAKLLGQDPEPVLSEYLRSLEASPESTPSPGYSIPTWVERERQRGSRRTTYALAAVVVLFIGLVLAWVSTRTSMRKVPPPPVTAVSPPSPMPAENAATAAAEPKIADNTAQQPAPETAAVPADNNAPAPQSVVTSVGGVGPVKSPYQLFLEASEMTWLMYGLDDQEPVDVMLYPGDKISIQARKKIFLKLGNAGGVVGTLNGKLLPPFGARGQVKEIRLGE
ncbi:MAG: DUF4115 domain-containing protein [Deltaproteobacteria bacterium]|nr:DUF4115 domain-containing protein [Deltaproteobacteria bacterium]